MTKAPETYTANIVEGTPDFLKAAEWAGLVAVDRDMTLAQQADWDQIVPETPVD